MAKGKGDEREALVASLLDAIERVNGSVVTYSGFENQRLRNLALWFPRYAQRIQHIRKRIFDLLPVISRHVYHRDFFGSFSLKRVLPVFVQGMSYDYMAISDGDAATTAFERICRGGLSPADERRLRKALMAYCCQDTLGLTRLVERLHKILA